MGIVSTHDLSNILETLLLMEEMESAVSAFYKECAAKWPLNSEFWISLANEELRHKTNIEKMRSIVSGYPQDFEKGRPFNMVATKTIINGIVQNTNKVKMEEITEHTALSIALDIEKSFIESRYMEILKTDSPEYTALVSEVSRETQQHRSRILKALHA